MSASAVEWAKRIGFPIMTFVLSFAFVMPLPTSDLTIYDIAPTVFVIWLLGCTAGMFVMTSLWIESKESKTSEVKP